MSEQESASGGHGVRRGLRAAGADETHLPRVGAVALVTFLVVMGASIIAPALPAFQRAFGLSTVQVGAMVGAFAIGRLLLALPGGLLADRFGFRAVALAGCMTTGASAAISAVTSSFPVLLAAQLGQGAGSAMYTTAAMLWVVSAAPPGRVAQMVARYQSAVLLGMSFAPVLGGLCTAVLGMRGPLLFYAASALAGAVITVTSAERTPVRPAAARGDTRERRRLLRALSVDRAYLSSTVALFVFFWLLSGVRSTALPLFAASAIGLSEALIGVLLAMIGLINVALLRVAGRSLDGVGRRPALRWGNALVGCALVWLAVVGDGSTLFGAAALFGVGTAFAAVAPVAIVVDVADPLVRGAAIGIQRTVAALGLTLGPVTLGAVVDVAGFPAAFLGAGAVVACVVALTWLMPETKDLAHADAGGSRKKSLDPAGL